MAFSAYYIVFLVCLFFPRLCYTFSLGEISIIYSRFPSFKKIILIYVDEI